jgi:hypothetical protein
MKLVPCYRAIIGRQFVDGKDNHYIWMTVAKCIEQALLASKEEVFFSLRV